MALICRLATRKLTPGLAFYKPEFCVLARHVTLKSVPYVPKSDDEVYDYHVDNMKKQRPQSPHLTIYKPQLTSMLSISQRFTGIILTGYAGIIATGALALPHDISYYIEALQAAHIGVVPILALKFILAFPFSYHLCCGIRFLIWYCGLLISKREIYRTGYIMLAATAAMSIGLTLL